MLCVGVTELEASVKATVRLEPLSDAALMIGEFCRLFAPVSPSPASLMVESGRLSRLMPPALAVIELWSTALPADGEKSCTAGPVRLGVRVAAGGCVLRRCRCGCGGC